MIIASSKHLGPLTLTPESGVRFLVGSPSKHMGFQRLPESLFCFPVRLRSSENFCFALLGFLEIFLVDSFNPNFILINQRCTHSLNSTLTPITVAKPAGKITKDKVLVYITDQPECFLYQTISQEKWFESALVTYLM